MISAVDALKVGAVERDSMTANKSTVLRLELMGIMHTYIQSASASPWQAVSAALPSFFRLKLL